MYQGLTRAVKDCITHVSHVSLSPIHVLIMCILQSLNTANTEPTMNITVCDSEVMHTFLGHTTTLKCGCHFQHASFGVSAVVHTLL